ncbi:MAG: VacJ family lipoprotein, partial [Lentisphaeraceae bacterium]|nr:VacJ family lipoprotein [Lentisphaeraceae bacterium]
MCNRFKEYEDSFLNVGVVSMKYFLLLILLFATGCSTNFGDDLPESEKKTDSDLMLEGVADPLEPFNRTMFTVNKGLFEYAIYPASEGYNYVMPVSARKGIRHFYQNLTYPIRVVNNLLQTEWEEAWIETKRFGINTTEGILGFRDTATDKYKLEEQKEDFGLTLQHYGWEPQMYLFLPFFGSSSDRDLVGKTGDYFLDPTTYYFPAGVPLKFNDISFSAKPIYDVLTQQYDAYELSHLVYSLSRTLPKYQPTYDSEMQANSVQTIYALFARPQNADFYKLIEEREIELEDFKESFKYNVFRQEKPAKTVYILPGLGEYRSSNRIQFLAELAYSQGYNVVSISSPFNWEFLTSSPEGFLPGYIEDDLVLID